LLDLLADLLALLGETQLMETQTLLRQQDCLQQDQVEAVEVPLLPAMEAMEAMEDFPPLLVVVGQHVGLQQAHLVQEAQALLALQSSQPTSNYEIRYC
jgi:hypothetical protein